jgi:hypothetical protein
MTDITCTYPDREAVLAGYLYDDLETAERVAFDSHVMTCLPCRSELAELRQVRTTLGKWAPPEPTRVLAFEPRTSNPEPRTWWHHVPVWAQVAAAMLVLGVSASIANLDIRYDSRGLNVTTGWSKPAPVTPAMSPTVAPAAVAETVSNDSVSREEFNQLRAQLQSELRARASVVRAASAVVPAGATMSDGEFERRVRALLDESEKNQKKELAVRLVQMQRDFSALLQNERGQTNQLFRDVTNTYGPQLQNQQKQINYLLPAGR